jgi:hypothetical protein
MRDDICSIKSLKKELDALFKSNSDLVGSNEDRVSVSGCIVNYWGYFQSVNIKNTKTCI